jgi:hypothetical protein
MDGIVSFGHAAGSRPANFCFRCGTTTSGQRMRPRHPWIVAALLLSWVPLKLGHVWCLLSHIPCTTTQIRATIRSGRHRSLILRGDGVGTTSADATTIGRANRDSNIHDDDVRSLLEAALAKMKIVQEEGGLFETSSSSSPSTASSVALLGFGKQMSDAVEARESSILNAGRGLFARQNIKTGTIVSLYPVHCLGVDGAQEDDESSPALRCYMDQLDEQYFERQQEHGKAGAYLQFLMGSRSLLNTNVNGPLLRGRPLFVDVNPQRTTGRPINYHNATTTTTTTASPSSSSSNCFLAHLVNDGSVVREASEQGLLDYYTSSRQRKNCVFIPFGPAPVLALVTTCDVPRGEELLTSYGANYWMERLAQDGDAAGGDENIDIITDQVLALVRESARDILVSMRAAHATYDHQQDALTKIWDAFYNGNSGVSRRGSVDSRKGLPSSPGEFYWLRICACK